MAPEDAPWLSTTPIRDWTQALAPFRGPPNLARSIFELIITAVPFLLLWAAAWFASSQDMWWASLPITIPASGFLVRLFMIQHDCGHGAFFHKRSLNDWTGRLIGVLTMTPYSFWRRTHAVHHSTCGNLDRRGVGDIDTLTVQEYFAKSRTQRLWYRIYRNPIFLFMIGPTMLFLFRFRLPTGLRMDRESWISTQATTLAIAALAVLLISIFGLKSYLLVQAPILVIAASAGVWLFYIQHQFEHTFWMKSADWKFQEASLHGSSFYDLPAVLRWFTANIGYHHIHHLSSKIPFYRLPGVAREYPELTNVGRLTLGSSLHCASLSLWDEEERRLISFRDAYARRRAHIKDLLE